MKDKFPACWFYWKDWLDFKVQRMTDAAQGIYMRLLAYIWTGTATQHSIADDNKALARALGLPIHAWLKRRAEIQWPGDPLLIEENGLLISKRLRREVEKLRARQTSGCTSADKREEQAAAKQDVKEPEVDAAKISPEIWRRVDCLQSNIAACIDKHLPFMEQDSKRSKWRTKTARAIDKLHRLDNVSFEDIDAAMLFIRNDKPRGTWGGWQAVILSGDNLRQHWDTIVVQMRRGETVNAASAPDDWLHKHD